MSHVEVPVDCGSFDQFTCPHCHKLHKDLWESDEFRGGGGYDYITCTGTIDGEPCGAEFRVHEVITYSYEVHEIRVGGEVPTTQEKL